MCGVQRLNKILLPHRLVMLWCLVGFAAPMASWGLQNAKENWDRQYPFPCSKVSFRGLGSTWDPRQAYLHLVMQWWMALLSCSVAAQRWFRLLPVITAILCTLNSSCICPSRVHLLPARSSFLAVLWLAAWTLSHASLSFCLLLAPACWEINLLGLNFYSCLNIGVTLTKKQSCSLSLMLKAKYENNTALSAVV